MSQSPPNHPNLFPDFRAVPHFPQDLQLYFGDAAPLAPLELEDAQALPRQQVWQVPDVTVAKSTGECLSAAVEAFGTTGCVLGWCQCWDKGVDM